MNEHLRAEAEARHNIHKHQFSHRPLSVDYEFIGILGQEKFAEISGLPRNRELLAEGDEGKHFISPRTGLVVNISAARKPGNLIIKKGKVVSDRAYVLGRYSDKTEDVTLLGWEWGKTLLKSIPKDFGYGILNHYIKRDKLLQIQELLRLL